MVGLPPPPPTKLDPPLEKFLRTPLIRNKSFFVSTRLYREELDETYEFYRLIE